jgi:hypothetical protein
MRASEAEYDPAAVMDHPSPLLERIPEMTIDELLILMEEDQLEVNSPEYALVSQRFKKLQLLADMKRVKRTLEGSDDEISGPSKRAKMEFKYTNISKLEPTATLRQFADWKADMTNLFDGSPSKFRTNSMKIIAAQQYMTDQAKALWRTHLRSAPSDDTWDKFLQWAQIVVARGANFMASIAQEHHEAHQKESQSPVKFDAYLSSLESVMDERSQPVQAMDFFTRLSRRLRAKMEMSGRDQLPATRQEMVAFAQRVWHGLEQANVTKGKDSNFRSSKDQSLSSSPFRTRVEKNYGHFWRRGRNSPLASRITDPTKANKFLNGTNKFPNGTNKFLTGTYKFPTGTNDKRESCCFKCGSTKHFAKTCDESGPSDAKEPPKEKKPKVQQVKKKQLDDLSDSDSDNSEN